MYNNVSVKTSKMHGFEWALVPTLYRGAIQPSGSRLLVVQRCMHYVDSYDGTEWSSVGSLLGCPKELVTKDVDAHASYHCTYEGASQHIQLGPAKADPHSGQQRNY
jgi:hypothetical protein